MILDRNSGSERLLTGINRLIVMWISKWELSRISISKEDSKEQGIDSLQDQTTMGFNV